MWLQVGITHTRVLRATEAEHAWLYHFLGVPETGFYRKGMVMRRKPLYDPRSQTFPSGLLSLVEEWGRKEGYAVEVLDVRKRPVEPDPTANAAWLRPYQDEAVCVAGSEYRGIVHAPTGAGKTSMMIGLAQAYPCVTGVFVPSLSLLTQIAEEFENRLDEPIGIIGDSVWNPRRVTVASFQTVHRERCSHMPRAKEWLDSLQMIHVDEAHEAAANTYFQTLMATPNAFFRIGYSATPFDRGDKKGAVIVGALGPTIYRVTPDVLVDIGAIAKPKIRFAEFVHTDSLAWNYDAVYEELIVRNARRNALVVKIAASLPKPCMVFVKKIDHGLQEMLPAMQRAGLRAEFVHGAVKGVDRDAIKRQAALGKLDIIIANKVFQAGVDLPELRSIVNAAAGKSHIAVLQQAGRGSRRKDKSGNVVKDAFDVVDIADVGCGCKYQNAAGDTKYTHKCCEWMERHTRERRSAYVGQNYDVTEGPWL